MTNRVFSRSALTFPTNPNPNVVSFEVDNERFQTFRFNLEQILIELESSYQNRPPILRRGFSFTQPPPIQKKPPIDPDDEFDFDIDARWI